MIAYDAQSPPSNPTQGSTASILTSTQIKMKKIQEYIQRIWRNRFESIDEKTLKEIYAFSFYVYDEEDDSRCPTLTIGFNTYSNLKENSGRASNESEAKGNYAFWLQNEIAVIGDSGDEEGKSIIGEWISNLELNYSDKEEDEDFEKCIEKGEKITKEFIKMLIEVVKSFHEFETNEIPILIHELEYYDEIRDQNILANGEEKVKEFSKWINEMYE